MKNPTTELTKGRRGILLVNLGSPDSTEVPDVKRYLRQFLSDEFVIDAPYLIRKMIVELFILPFRPKESAHAYSEIWWDEGSPLIVLSERVTEALRERCSVPIALGMRYGNPSIEAAVNELLEQGVDDILLIPLYPHYAMATVKTVTVELNMVLEQLDSPVKLTIHPPFYKDPVYIHALVESAREHFEKEYDYLLFSYHGIPERHCQKTDPTGAHCFRVENCCDVASEAHAVCYRHQVVETTRAFAELAGLPEEKYGFSFQSRLGLDSWLKPFTDKEIVRLAEEGKKKLLIISPAFVSDCLETLEELGIRAKEDFLEAGGEEFTLIPCMNVHPLWIDALEKWVGEFIQEEVAVIEEVS